MDVTPVLSAVRSKRKFIGSLLLLDECWYWGRGEAIKQLKVITSPFFTIRGCTDKNGAGREGVELVGAASGGTYKKGQIMITNVFL